MCDCVCDGEDCVCDGEDYVCDCVFDREEFVCDGEDCVCDGGVTERNSCVTGGTVCVTIKKEVFIITPRGSNRPKAYRRLTSVCGGDTVMEAAYRD